MTLVNLTKADARPPGPSPTDDGRPAADTSARAPLVSVRNLSKDFLRPNGSQFAAIESLSLDIRDGEFLAIVGVSGSGKSTLLKCMAGLVKPDRGHVTFHFPRQRDRQPTSIVFQNHSLFPWLTVRENIELAAQHLHPDEKRGQVDRILEHLRLGGFEDCYPRELSSGMKQRVSISRAMVCDPMVLFLDEPFTSHDPLTAQSLRAEIARLWSNPERTVHGVVLVTHSIDEAVLLADRVVILSASPGQVAAVVDVPLARPRQANSPEMEAVKERLEELFSDIHLRKLVAADLPAVPAPMLPTATAHPLGQSGVPHATSAVPTTAPMRRMRPLINTSLILVEGLLNLLAEANEPLDLYDLCDKMGQSVDEMLPAVAAAEMLGFINMPGTELSLTADGAAFVNEHNPQARRNLSRQAVLKLPLVSSIHDLLMTRGSDGLEKSIVLEQIVMMLPFEDFDIQFDALLKWGRYADLLSYDAARELLFAEE